MNVNTHDVNLLIFDLDGTIVSSLKPTYEAIKRAFLKLNLPVQVSESEIEKYFGASSDEFYQAITSPDRLSMWQEVRTRVRQEYESTLRDYGSVFPGVKETLIILRKRGYGLILYSNSSVRWFKSSISACYLESFFDYAECVEENGLTKADLIRKFIKKFGNPKAAIIGDRIHDIQAARETNSLSIGVLFGYGGKEPEEADITIAEFSALLNIFDRQLPIFEQVLREIDRRKQDNKAFVVGITGVDVSGKTRFTESFAMFLTSNGRNVQVISLDDFHNPQQVRYSGENQPENYYNKSFDINTIVERLLIPIKQRSRYSVKLTLLDLHTNRYEVDREFSFGENTIVLFEGVFLLRKELSPYIDYKIFIDVPFEESKNRAKNRDVPIYGDVILRKYDEKYFPAQGKYLYEYPPSEIADMIIDNTNWEYPRVTYLRE